jgi:hypothetical protein
VEGGVEVEVVAMVPVVVDPAGGDAVQAAKTRTSTAKRRVLMVLKRTLGVGGSPKLPVGSGNMRP